MSREREPSEPSCYCKLCGYDLRLLESKFCPECGREFDSDNPATFRQKPPHGRLYWWVTRTTGTAVLILLLLAGWLGWTYWDWQQERSLLAEYNIKPTPWGCCRAADNYYYCTFLGPDYVMDKLGAENCFMLERVAGLELRGTQPQGPQIELDIESSGPPHQKPPESKEPLIPFLNHLGAFSHLERLEINKVKLKDLLFLNRATKLKHLTLRNLPIHDADLATLNSLRRLDSLEISDMDITDAGFQQFDRWDDLTWLLLDQTQADDRTIHRLRYNTKLDILYLRYTAVSDAGMDDLGNMTQLHTLGLSGTAVTKEGLKKLQRLSNLDTLHLSRTHITEDGLSALVYLNKLKTLYLGHIKLTAKGIDYLLACPTLREVSFNADNLSRSDLERLLAQSQIKSLYLVGDKAKSEGWEQLENNHPGVSIWIDFDIQ